MYTQKAIRRPKTINTEPSKTDQSFKDDCDVNIVLQRFMKTGDESIFRKGGSYSDVSEVPDLLEAHLNLQRAKLAFDQLPAQLRKKLENNPLMLEQYLADPANHEEAIELGLLRARPEDSPASKPAVGEKATSKRGRQDKSQSLPQESQDSSRKDPSSSSEGSKSET